MKVIHILGVGKQTSDGSQWQVARRGADEDQE